MDGRPRLQKLKTSGQSNLTKKVSPQPHMVSSVVFARWRQCAPPVIHASVDPPPRVHIQNGIWISSAIFPQFTAHIPYTLPWAAHFSSPQTVHFAWGIWTHLITLHWTHQVHNPNGILMSSAVLAGLTTVIDWPCYSTCNNRPHQHS